MSLIKKTIQQLLVLISIFIVFTAMLIAFIMLIAAYTDYVDTHTGNYPTITTTVLALIDWLHHRFGIDYVPAAMLLMSIPALASTVLTLFLYNLKKQG